MSFRTSLIVGSAALALLLIGCGGGGSGSTTSSPTANAANFQPNPDGFSFVNDGQVEIDDLTDKNIATLYGANNVCYNGDANNCLLTAMGNYQKISQLKGQQGGQCYGFAVASAMLYYGGYDFEGKTQASDFNPSASKTYDLAKSDVDNFIAMTFTNQFTPQVQNVINQCANSDTITQYNKIKQSLQSNDPSAVLAFYALSGQGGHAVTPYKVSESGNEAKIWVYDNNYPGQDNLYFSVSLANGYWEYAAGRTNANEEASSDYKGQGTTNPFCSIALSETQYKVLENSRSARSDVQVVLNGQAENVQLLMSNNQSKYIGYDFDNIDPGATYLNQISGAKIHQRFDGMPPMLQIPIPSNLTNLHAITSPQDYNVFFQELYFGVAAKPYNDGKSNTISLSMDAANVAFQSALQITDVPLQQSITQDEGVIVGFHPGGKFLMLQRAGTSGSLPKITLYYDDFQLQQGAIHEFSVNEGYYLADNYTLGIFIQDVKTLGVFIIDPSGENVVDLTENIEYSVSSRYVDHNGVRQAPVRTIKQPLGSAYRLRVGMPTKRGVDDFKIERLF
ncbi:MAG: hypothetical protein U9N52_03635 [Campylobacterota bacterium]|nr:hypothetical protein [Campylobacterota bacterium]